MATERMGFQAEVTRLLEIVAHSLYSDKAVFLRELVANAADACDRLRYLAQTEPGLLAGDPTPRVTLIPDAKAKRLTIADNGIGMDRQELIDHLGTIARSGSAKFMADLAAAEGDEKISLIGQFGVGFYSAFMVAEKVEVLSRRAGAPAETAWLWASDGKGSFTMAPATKAERGTEIILHLKKGETEWLEATRLEAVIRRHSAHIAIPIWLADKDGPRQIAANTALWTRPRAAISAEEYRDFYRDIAHALDEPWATLHFSAEGKIDYTGLLFIPKTRPFDLFHPDRANSLKLYQKRIFVTERVEDLLPSWLRFVKGLVDCADLPLNISREMLQESPLLARIRAALVKRLLGELQKRAADKEDYALFWENFGAVLKEGLYEPNEQREILLDLARFKTTASAEWTSLAEYRSRLRPGQNAIYYMTGESAERIAASAQLEGYRAKGVEVLLLSDPIDEFWIGAIGEYQGSPLKSASRGAADLEAIAVDAAAPSPPPAPSGIDPLIALMRLALKDKVKDVRVSARLTESAVCLVAGEGDLDLHLERLLRQHQKLDRASLRELEVNAGHPLIAAMAKGLSAGKGEVVGDIAEILFEEARIESGESPGDAKAFAARLNRLLAGLL